MEKKIGMSLLCWGGTCSTKLRPFRVCNFKFLTRGGVLEGTAWSPWPRSFRCSKIALSLSRGQRYFLNRKNFVDRVKKVFGDLFFWKSPEKVFENLFFWRSPEKNFWIPFFWKSPEKKFLRPCFFENTCPCVLGPWPWPRALCPRLHLCF